jgi:hypothetical protein
MEVGGRGKGRILLLSLGSSSAYTSVREEPISKGMENESVLSPLIIFLTVQCTIHILDRACIPVSKFNFFAKGQRRFIAEA